MEISVKVNKEVLDDIIKILAEADNTINFDNVDKIIFYK